MKEYRVLDHRRTDQKAFSRFRDQCLNSRMLKAWVKTDEGNPEFSGLFFVRHDDSPGEFDIAEFFINMKGKRFWLTPKPPTYWAEIETYDYVWEDGKSVYDEI